ncbi:MAG: polyprenyl synthetase family protein [Bacteroidota bacterium]|nr:polyprenyl synthetase family protein [Bacteroidota bacterium]
MDEAKIKPLLQLARLYEEYSKLQNWHREPYDLYSPVNYIMGQQGKKLRPLSLLFIFQLFKDSVQDAMHAAYALELFHNFTLMHDDIMDQAELRRGQDTTYKKFGLSAAILSGDVMLIDSFSYLQKTESLQIKNEIMDDFIKTSREICEGQSMDMSFEKKTAITLEEYLEMIRLKTAVLLACALKMGAKLANQSNEICNQFYALGIQLGLAFQVQDDWLDFYGNEIKVGKTRAGDVLQCKKSALILLATAAIEEEERIQILQEYHTKTNDEDKIKKFEEIFTKYQVENRISNLFNDYQQKINVLIKDLKLSLAQELALNDFVKIILNRTS